MKKVTLKTPAKVNLTLDILGVAGGFHDIKSLVTSISIYDSITVKKRSDSRITLTMQGIPFDCDMFDNNAYKAAALFKERFETCGVDVVIKKGIPVGGGLGGSSADIAGVLNAMEKLFNTGKKMLPLANELGSDSGYMLQGGYAVISGRGDKISYKDIDKKLYFIIIPEKKSVSARASYKAFDKQGKIYKPCTSACEKALKENDFNKYISLAKNDLFSPSAEIVPEIQGNYFALKRAGVPLAMMTGSGSCVYGVFENEKERNKAYKKLFPLYGKTLIKAQSI